MIRVLIAVASLIAVAACTKQSEPTYTFTELSYAGATATVASGINAAGHIVGSYWQEDRTYGFVYKDGTYTSVEYPGAVLTQLYGIGPDGDIVGSYRRADEAPKPGESSMAYHGFLLTKSGEFLELGHPDQKYTMAQRILPDRTVVGCYHGDDVATTMHGITIKGDGITPGGVNRAAITTVDVPGSMNTGATPDGTKVVGFDAAKGQAYTIDRGTLTAFTAPDAKRTEAWDISPSGVIVGAFVDTESVSHGYVLENGRFTTIDFPGAKSTVALGINARGDIVGGFETADGQRRGYLASRR